MGREKNLFLYIHVPFCRSKCPYCGFYSIVDSELEDIYSKTLAEELRLYSEIIDFTGMELQSIYFGGGTPSSISCRNLDFILQKIYSLFPVRNNPEITIEANPESLNTQKLAFYKNAGINRISIGIQSCLDKNLKVLGRNHRFSQINKILTLVTDFPNVSLDFIYHIPGQTIEELQQEFRLIKEYGPQHISFYGLILEENTRFFDLYKEQIDEETYRSMYLLICEELRKMGYEHYEISNFAKSGYISRHNSAYWDFSDYLGLGPASASYIKGQRFKNISSVKDYIINMEKRKLSITEPEERDDEDILLEKVFLGLRKRPGLNLAEITKEANTQEILEKMAVHIPEHLWCYNKPFVTLTTEGFLLSNSIMIEVYDIISLYHSSAGSIALREELGPC